MCASISVADDVGVTLDGFIVGIGPLHGQLDMDFSCFNFTHALDVDDIWVDGVPTLIQLFYKFRDATVILVFNDLLRIPSLVNNCDFQSSIEECCFTQTCIEDIIIKFSDGCEYA